MRVLATREGQMVDQLTVAAIGTDAGGVVETALGLTPGLAEDLAGNGHVLALDRIVTVDDAPRPAPTVATVKLWD